MGLFTDKRKVLLESNFVHLVADIVQTLRTNELKVWTVLSTDDIYTTTTTTKCPLSYLVQ